jgi:hypothetical protein
MNMNRVLLLTAGLFLALSTQAQTDTTGKNDNWHPGGDTLRVGNLLIIRNGPAQSMGDPYVRIRNRHYNRSYRPSNISTNWGIVDLGFTNYNDKTNYTSVSARQFAPGGSKDWFKLNTGKSVDVNIWIFMQRINLIAHVVNLKWGLGIELNNYRYEENIRFLTDPTKVVMDTINYKKNKLAEDFATVPVMLNFNLTPHRRHPFGFSAGASFGYRYSSRQKFKSSEDGKQKTFNDFDLDPWKISYIGELQLGWINLYGSYATKTIFNRGLDQVPYSFGIRIGNW